MAEAPAWIPQELHEEEPNVVIRFNRDCRTWPAGTANTAFSDLLMDISGGEYTLVATDGSYDSTTNRAGWGFAIYENGQVTQQGAGAHQVYTSSTRMELEAIRRALPAAQGINSPATLIFATDSMAILNRIRSGQLPQG